MKSRMMLLILSISLNAFSGTTVIYGDDDRKDLYEVNNNLHLTLAKSTAAMIKSSSLSKKWFSNDIKIKGKTLQERGICKEERFSAQLSAANCSGFLVGKNLLVTAGHCIKDQRSCDSYKWVFDFKMDEASKAEYLTTKDKVYACKRIINRSLDNSTKDDWALIELEREVHDRDPLQFRTEGKPEVNAPLVVIGHPTGIPTKVADGAWVKTHHNTYFRANLDTYGGNSGSAVFDSETGIVEGILVRGATDYVRDPSGCMKSNRISNDAKGEEVTYITNIKELQDL